MVRDKLDFDFASNAMRTCLSVKGIEIIDNLYYTELFRVRDFKETIFYGFLWIQPGTTLGTLTKSERFELTEQRPKWVCNGA